MEREKKHNYEIKSFPLKKYLHLYYLFSTGSEKRLWMFINPSLTILNTSIA